MKVHLICAVAAVGFVCIAAGILQADEASSTNDLFMARFAGKWKIDTSLTERIGGRASQSSFEIRKDSSILEKLPKDQLVKVKEGGVFGAGLLIRGEKSSPFVLSQAGGVLMLVYFRDRDGEPLADSESMFFAQVIGSKRDKDMLFLGGDSEAEAFRAYVRQE